MVWGHGGQSVCVVLVPKGVTGRVSHHCLENLRWKYCIYTEGDAKSCSSAQSKKLGNTLEPGHTW